METLGLFLYSHYDTCLQHYVNIQLKIQLWTFNWNGQSLFISKAKSLKRVALYISTQEHRLRQWSYLVMGQ